MVVDQGKALAVIPNQYQPLSLADSQQISTIMFKAGLFQDTKSEAQALVKVLYGQELGVGPIAAMTGIVITSQGRISFGANFMAARVKASGKYNFRTTEHTDMACSIDFFERTKDGWEKVGTSRFTIDDAKRAQLNNANYGKYPKNMLFARAMSNGAKFYAADAFGGITPYVPEDFGAAIDPESGNVIEGEIVREEPQAATQPRPQTAVPKPQPQPAPQSQLLRPTPPRPQQQAPVSAEVVVHPTLPCSRGKDCVGNGKIMATQIGDKVYSAEEMAAATTKNFKQALCYRCGQKAKEQAEAPAAPKAEYAGPEYQQPEPDPEAGF